MFRKILLSCRNKFYIISEKDIAQIQSICSVLNVKKTKVKTKVQATVNGHNNTILGGHETLKNKKTDCPWLNLQKNNISSTNPLKCRRISKQHNTMDIR